MVTAGRRWMTFGYLVIAVLTGCYPERSQSPTSGSLSVRIAESVAPPVIRQIDAFHALYADRGAHISYEVVTSLEAVQGFVQDTFRLAVTVDSLTAEEYTTVDAMDGSFLVRTAALDGIAVVVHPSNRLTTVTTTQLRGMLTGEIARWRQINADAPSGRIRVVLQPSSDVSRYLGRTVLGGSAMSVTSREAGASTDLLARIAGDPEGIGFVGLTWVDSAAGGVKTLSVLMDHAEGESWYPVAEEARGIAYSPHPANIVRGYYPLIRKVYLLSRAAPGGDLATGFGAYILNSAGQKIFFEAGMIPATQTIQLRR